MVASYVENSLVKSITDFVLSYPFNSCSGNISTGPQVHGQRCCLSQCICPHQKLKCMTVLYIAHVNFLVQENPTNTWLHIRDGRY